MEFGVYLHIPYCIQRCRYCDFTTFEQNSIMPPKDYVRWLIREISSRRHWVSYSEISSIYFGGGTPSLLETQSIVDLLHALANAGFTLSNNAEVTIEINPATLTPKKLEAYLSAGVNRFSVGAQTFNDRLLQVCGREHSAQETRETLSLLQNYNVNFSADVLFALPNQTQGDLSRDLEEVLAYCPSHISPYCLTVPEGHPLSFQRPSEEAQIEMFEVIEKVLQAEGYFRYEISNFSRPGRESRHNLVYWENQPYWGLGLSSHSYFPDPDYGQRFWNSKSFSSWMQQIEISEKQPQNFIEETLPPAQREKLHPHEALTDFCHTSFRLRKGLSSEALRQSFPENMVEKLKNRLSSLLNQRLIETTNQGWRLTSQGLVLSNQVFFELTFDREDLTGC